MLSCMTYIIKKKTDRKNLYYTVRKKDQELNDTDDKK